MGPAGRRATLIALVLLAAPSACADDDGEAVNPRPGGTAPATGTPAPTATGTPGPTASATPNG